MGRHPTKLTGWDLFYHPPLPPNIYSSISVFRWNLIQLPTYKYSLIFSFRVSQAIGRFPLCTFKALYSRLGEIGLFTKVWTMLNNRNFKGRKGGTKYDKWWESKRNFIPSSLRRRDEFVIKNLSRLLLLSFLVGYYTIQRKLTGHLKLSHKAEISIITSGREGHRYSPLCQYFTSTAWYSSTKYLKSPMHLDELCPLDRGCQLYVQAGKAFGN